MIVKAEYWINSDGTFNKYWKIKYGKLHREDGPAIEYFNGIREWFKNGLRHREDGPAVIWENGAHEYYLNGKEYTKEDYWKEIEKIRRERKRKKDDFES